MRRTHVAPAVPLVLGALILAATACGVQGEPAPAAAQPSRTSASSTPSGPVSASATPSTSTHGSPAPPSLQLPGDAPSTFDRASTVAELAQTGFEDLAPPGAAVTSDSVLARPNDPIDQIALAWRRGDDPLAPETGFVLWQRFGDPPPWRAVYAFTAPPSEGVLGTSLQTGDLTGDAISDILTFEMTGGSGACGTYRVIGSAPGSAAELFRRETCDAEIQIVGQTLMLREAVYRPEDAHCCPSAFRVTVLEWDGRGFVPTSSETTPA